MVWELPRGPSSSRAHPSTRPAWRLAVPPGVFLRVARATSLNSQPQPRKNLLDPKAAESQPVWPSTPLPGLDPLSVLPARSLGFGCRCRLAREQCYPERTPRWAWGASGLCPPAPATPRRPALHRVDAGWAWAPQSAGVCHRPRAQGSGALSGPGEPQSPRVRGLMVAAGRPHSRTLPGSRKRGLGRGTRRGGRGGQRAV